jgi:hypothetical protein
MTARSQELPKLIRGLITCQLPDSVGDVCHYETTKPFYQRYCDMCAEETNGDAFGVLCASHNSVPVGKAVEPPEFNDAERSIWMMFEITDAETWNLILNGHYTGFSHKVKIVKRWNHDGFAFYTGKPIEISVAHLPLLRCAKLEILPSIHCVMVRPSSPVCPVCGSALSGYTDISVCNSCALTFPKYEIQSMAAAR